MGKTISIVFGLLLLAILVSGLWLNYNLHAPNSGAGTLINLEIPNGAVLRQVTDSLEVRRLLRNSRLFHWWARLRGLDRNLQKGEYLIPDTLSILELLDFLTSGRQAQVRVTLPEGLTAAKTVGILARKLDLDSTEFSALLTDARVLQKFRLDGPSLEGRLFPDTYYFFLHQEPLEVLETLVNRFREVFDPLYERYGEASGLTPLQAVTLASIVQGEMRDTSEARTIASVYINRLRRNWKLQADPTVQYLLPEGPRRLLLKDLKIPSPYNTYLHRGLPPGPINNPGREALAAALHPRSTPFLFFVADGRGKHLFSRTPEEHARARRTLDSLRRQLQYKRNP